jgi:predicted O-methyltransferase YrrM
MAQELSPDMKVFEWGSGGSTFFLASRVRSVVSVEHDPTWFDHVTRELGRRRVDNVDLRLVVPELLTDDAVSQRTGDYRSSVPKFANMHFSKYVQTIATLPDESLDLVLIDGRSRSACAAVALSKVKRGGAVVLDDSDRVDTLPAIDVFDVSAWKALHFAGPGPASRWPVSWRTSVFVKR